MKRPFVLLLLLIVTTGMAYSAYRASVVRVGRQTDGSFIVATGQHIEPGSIAFDGRPIDLAISPEGKYVAVLNQRDVFLVTEAGIVPDSAVFILPKKRNAAGFHGIAWNPDGKHLYASTSLGYVQELRLADTRLELGRKLQAKPAGAKGDPGPGGMTLTRDGKRLFVTAANRNAVAEIDTVTGEWKREWKVQNIPFEVRLSEDEATAIVSNWGGRLPQPGDETAESVDVPVVIDPRGVASTGTVTLIDRRSGSSVAIEVGLHPSGLCVQRNSVYVANAGSDSISEINIAGRSVARNIPIRWGGLKLFGSMPNALAVYGSTLYACNGGDNAICEIDLPSGKVRGHRPAGFFPTGIAIGKDGKTAFVVNTKGNGSVAKTVLGKTGNAHDFQGTVSVIDLSPKIEDATARVAQLNIWPNSARGLRPNLPVYRGAIKHILYIIKENRTYDQVFGDLPQGDGDPKLCSMGERLTPNHRALATEFTLFDNTYVSGTNSGEGHQWATEAICNDYVERYYSGYSRTYPDDGDDPMAIASSGFIWDAAAKKGKTVRVYGEMANIDKAEFIPKPKSWLDTWNDRKNGTHKYRTVAHTSIAGLQKYLHPEYLYWPLLISDQHRADMFIEEYTQRSKEDKVPNLLIMSLPCDHTEGTDPTYPKPASMIADNDLALGRIVDAVSHSPQWKDTCVFVIEDDAQSGPDHIDGHRTVCLAISPYTRRKFVDSSFQTQISLLRSIEMMLGLDPMNKFDATAIPFTACFMNEPDLTPYAVKPNKIPLDDMNPPKTALTGRARFYAEKSIGLDWSAPDRADEHWLNRIVWHSLNGDRPYEDGRRAE